MSYDASRLIKFLSRPVDALGGWAGPDSRVTVRLPAGWTESGRDVFAAAAEQLVGRRAAELQLSSRVEVQVGEGSGPELAVSLDDRPLLHSTRVTEQNEPADWERLLGAIDGSLLRRLPLLLGRPGAEAAYLADLGVALPRPLEPPEDLTVGSIVQTAERLFDELAPKVIVAEVSIPTLRRTRSAQPDDLVRVRKRLFAATGVEFPDVRLTPVDEPPGTVRFQLNDVTLPTLHLGPDAGWSEVVGSLGEALLSRMHWFVRLSRVSASLETLSYIQPDLAAASMDSYPRPLLTACLRELVWGGQNVRNLPRMLWLLLELGSAGSGNDRLRLAESPLLPQDRFGPTAVRDPVVLASRLRKCVTEESWRTDPRSARLERAVRLPARVEASLVAAGDPQSLAAAEWQTVTAVGRLEPPEVVITHAVAAVARARAALQALPRPPRVIASQELAPDADLALIRTAVEVAS